ncbi:hypothetical protein HNQ59_003985 [Chitinivorax tropicus]|uniref:Lipoprotein n=1 Tax=Chitinivorax tropicus TaxID=714531 RepID=A0A840MQE6_9PROT|nr:hypothetical protein [Chitinivorax tropicus]MBB5020660.1 hypothetical protein [Chitinivorax tropicus]
MIRKFSFLIILNFTFFGSCHSRVLEKHHLLRDGSLRVVVNSNKGSLMADFPPPLECSMMGAYELRGSAEIVVDGSCRSRGGQADLLLLKYNDNSLCISRHITGELGDPVENPLPSYEVYRFSKCIPYKKGIDNYSDGNIVGKDFYVRWANEFILRLERKETGEVAASEFSEFDAAEMAGQYKYINVEKLNNIGFYLQKFGNNVPAAIILSKIVDKFPGRVVAKLNYADALWDGGYKKFAKIQYDDYISGMMDVGRAGKIPPYVFERVK